MCEALIGLLGAVVGALAVLASTFLQDWLANRKQEKLDKPRMAMLLHMLNHMPPGVEWREFDTLSRVIGASREETTRLLISVGARGSEAGNDVWALTSKKPLPGVE